MTYQIRAATAADLPHILDLMPRLAAFELPPGRNPEDLWRGDAEVVRRWAQGDLPGCIVYVAEGLGGDLLGVAVAQLREELLSHAPSAHLEGLAVRAGAEGQGVGAGLAAAVEREVRARGAESITLHVFGLNRRARALYARLGYTEELIRCIKPLS